MLQRVLLMQGINGHEQGRDQEDQRKDEAQSVDPQRLQREAHQRDLAVGSVRQVDQYRQGDGRQGQQPSMT